MTLSLFSNCRLAIVVTKEMDPRRILEFFFLLCFWCGHGMIDVSAAALVSELSLSRIILYDWPSLSSRQQGLDNNNNRAGQPAGAEARSSSTGYPQTKDAGLRNLVSLFVRALSDSGAWELGPSFDAGRHWEILYWIRVYTLVGCSILELEMAVLWSWISLLDRFSCKKWDSRKDL
jgi:hypothetical protein